MSFIKRIFTWWNGSTFGTLLEIRRRGVKIGEDAFGNTYFEEKKETFHGQKSFIHKVIGIIIMKKKLGFGK